MSLEQFWVGLYAVACILFPPLHFHGKSFYWAELLLVPLIPILLKRIVTGKIRPYPKVLLLTSAAVLVAYFSGLARGHLGADLNAYQNSPNPLNNDEFNMGKDTIVFFRWLLIFNTPWIVAQTLDKKPDLVLLFNKIFLYGASVSAVISTLEHFHVLNLVNWGFHEASANWAGRSFGTLSSPLEAGILFGAASAGWLAEALAVNGNLKIARLVMALLCVYGMYLSKTGTAVIALVGSLIYLVSRQRMTYKTRLFLLCAFVLGCAGFFVVIPPVFLVLKFNDFVYRSSTWFKFVSLLAQRPWLLLTGIGFSGLVVDNSIILLLIKGGLFLVLSVGAWLKKLYRYIPHSYLPIFIFWAVSWLALDSIGYWGLGRILWFLMGLLYSSGSLTTDSAERMRSSPPRGSTVP